MLVLITISCLGTLRSQNDIHGDIEKLEQFLSSLDNDYVDQIETRSIVEKGIRKMLEELDPHSVYLDPEAYARSNEPLKGKYKGIGVRFLMIDDTMTILDVVEGSGAELAGIKCGDQIIKVNEDTVSGRKKSASSISSSIKDQDDKSIDVTLIRKHPKRLIDSFLIMKSELPINSVAAYFMIEPRVGYIKLERFSSNSLNEFRTALDALKKERAKTLVIDLRGNGGGYLNVAIKIVDEFLEDRRMIVYTEGEHQNKREVFATSGGRYTNGELYVLIDANSASASEIFAGAIQDWDRGLIIGRRSYGKGLVQRTVEFKDGSAMRLTISRYYTPTGRSIQRSYENGSEAYRLALKSRKQTGELFSADSIDVIDSLIFYTPNHRKVYGGGGIQPDVFVPIDTSLNNAVISQIRRRALFQGFALEMKNKKEEMLRAQFSDVAAFLDGYALLDEDIFWLKEYLEAKEIEATLEELNEHREAIEEQMSIALSRYVFGHQAFYQALAYYDKDVAAARKEIEQGTFRQLGLK